VVGGQNRYLGPKRRRGAGEGLNRAQAEAKLRELMIRERPPAAGSSVSFAITADLMLRDLEALDRKPTTLDNYRSILRSHLLPKFGEVAVSQVKKAKSKCSWRR
jgi:integrase-like protein